MTKVRIFTDSQTNLVFLTIKQSENFSTDDILQKFWFVLVCTFLLLSTKAAESSRHELPSWKPLLSFEFHAPSFIELVIKSFYWDLQLNFIGNEFGIFQARMKFYVTFNFLFLSKAVQLKVSKFTMTSNVTFVLKRNIKGKCRSSKYFCCFPDKQLFYFRLVIYCLKWVIITAKLFS